MCSRMNTQDSERLRAAVARRMISSLNGCLSLPGHASLAAVTRGKMLRALLTMRLGRALSSDGRRILDCAAAVELAHFASLLHDDLIDGDTSRRGKPALWIARGPRYAVLAGDYLVSRAIRMIHRSAPDLLGLFSETIAEMCEAEFEQEIFGRRARLEEHRLAKISERKTGSLFGFAAACAAEKAGALRNALEKAGRIVGTAYQIADDSRDGERHKRSEPAGMVHRMARSALSTLGRWPAAGRALETYLSADFLPSALGQSATQLLPGRRSLACLQSQSRTQNPG